MFVLSLGWSVYIRVVTRYVQESGIKGVGSGIRRSRMGSGITAPGLETYISHGIGISSSFSGSGTKMYHIFVG